MISKAMVFPGQGSQYIGMGKSFYDNYKLVKDIYDCASDLLHFDVAKLCFIENDNINITEFTQPALLTTQYAIFKVFEEICDEVDIYAGLSLGEYSAAVASGALDFDDAVLLVNKRGKLMQEAAPIGETMMSAIIGLNDDQLTDICRNISDTLSITNYNAPGQLVIGGYKSDVIKANEAAEKANAIKVVPLEISVASHCFIQKEASLELEKAIESVQLKEIKKPYISNVTADLVEKKEEIKRLLVEQMYSPVKWAQSVKRMTELGVTEYFELGGDVMIKLIKRVNKKAVFHTIKEPDDFICLK